MSNYVLQIPTQQQRSLRGPAPAAQPELAEPAVQPAVRRPSQVPATERIRALLALN